MKYIKRFNENLNTKGLQDIKDEILFDVLDYIPSHKECEENGIDIHLIDFDDYDQVLWRISQDTLNKYIIYIRYICAPRATKELFFLDILNKKVNQWNNIGWYAKMEIQSDDHLCPSNYTEYEEDGNDQTSNWSENLHNWISVNLITITIDKNKKSA